MSSLRSIKLCFRHIPRDRKKTWRRIEDSASTSPSSDLVIEQRDFVFFKRLNDIDMLHYEYIQRVIPPATYFAEARNMTLRENLSVVALARGCMSKFSGAHKTKTRVLHTSPIPFIYI